MEFSQLMADILVYESCKFEMYIFEIAQVIGENVPIVFLYVLSIDFFLARLHEVQKSYCSQPGRTRSRSFTVPVTLC